MNGKFRILLCFTLATLGGCIGQTHSIVNGHIWMQQDTQPITAQTLLLVDVSQNIFAPIEVQQTQERHQKETLAHTQPQDLDQIKQQIAVEKQDSLVDYLESNRNYLQAVLIQNLRKNGINTLAIEDFKKNASLYANRSFLTLKVNLLGLESGKKDPRYVTATLGTHQLSTEVMLLDQRQMPLKECLKFDVKVDGWKPGIAVASKWNPLSQGGFASRMPDVDKTVHEVTPIIVEYFVNQHWLDSALAPDYPANQHQKKSLFDKLLFWQK
ncbi:hypothetical protein FAI41_06070 [Acetobacteraceae bacterium]|nr:hypothetical protein FAI41_06070 [Acetobacteraceae bacterium]